MPNVTVAEFRNRALQIRYWTDAKRSTLSLQLVPLDRLADVVQHRPNYVGAAELEALPWGHPDRRNPCKPDPLVHAKLVGDDYPRMYLHGSSLKHAPALSALRFETPELRRNGDCSTVLTRFSHPRGWQLEHRLWWFDDEDAVHVSSSFINGSADTLQLEALTSFSLAGVSPFQVADAPEALFLHRFRTSWSQEARHECRRLEDLHLETAWGGDVYVNERFGVNGSMPTKDFFPFVAVEDQPAGVFWGAQLAWAGSWQMEASRRDDWLSLSGGQADRESGHWLKSLLPGARFDAPEAVLAAVSGSLDDLCHALTRTQDRALRQVPAVEESLPIAFNDWCVAWGHPSHDFMRRILDRIAGLPITYVTMDAGWFNDTPHNLNEVHGDWQAAPSRFPQGLKATAEMIRQAGFVPGLWFEPETCGVRSAMFQQTRHLLQRDGVPLTCSGRRFLDLNDPWVHDSLQTQVIGLLTEAGFGYLKIDYNETLGVGVDHADSLGEGLRHNVQGWYGFLARLKAQLPDLVVENCASGGHRLEPSLMARCEMASFSDAHETTNIPILAAQLQRLILPRQSQIWAVLHAGDSDDRLAYSLAATFLGRMCISGEVFDLSAAQMVWLQRAMAFYQAAAPTIKHGRSSLRDSGIGNRRHATGWQAVLRVRDDGQQALCTAHSFNSPQPIELRWPLPAGAWAIADAFHTDAVQADVYGQELVLRIGRPYTGLGLLLQQTSAPAGRRT
ncbi:MAG: alpha-galactosidase [Chitinophagaceae bacterium]|nr:alpha-galactosidase [Rubrivivax sp.]